MNRTAKGQTTAVWMLLAAILSLGAVAVWFVVFGIGTMLYGWFMPNRSYTDQLAFTVEGQPLLQSYTPEGAYDGNYYAYRTLDGRKIEDPESLHFSEASGGGELPPAAKRDFRSNDWRSRIRSHLQARPAPVAWYLIHDANPDGHAWVVGYQPQSKQRIGYLGRNGFRRDLPPPDDRFDITLSLFSGGGIAPAMEAGGEEPRYRTDVPAFYIVSDRSLVKVDLARQATDTVAMPDNVISVGNYSELTAVNDDRHATHTERLLVRLPKELHVLTMEGQPLRTIPLTAAMQGANISLVGTTTDELIVIARGEEYTSPRELYWIGPAGEVKRQEQVILYPPGLDKSRSVAWGMTSALPAPAVLLAFSLLSAAINPRASDAPDFASAYAEIVTASWPPFLVLLAVSAGLAFVTYRRQRAMTGRGAIAWATFVMLLGPPGLVGYWTHRGWPAVARCEHCGAVVPRDRGTCLACAAEFPPPALVGIEVFA